jgi:predicted enzyme related to lactoylglutathione lyase
LAAAEAHGGRILMQPFRIEGVGDVGYFEDSEGNICGVAQYLPGLWK